MPRQNTRASIWGTTLPWVQIGWGMEPLQKNACQSGRNWARWKGRIQFYRCVTMYGKIPRNKCRSEYDGRFPMFASKHLVQTSRNVARKWPKEYEKHEHDRGQTSTRRRAQKPKYSKEECDSRHHKQLSSCSRKYREKHESIWRTENIGMNQLPPEILLGIFFILLTVVASNILMQCSQQNHWNHSCEEEDNHDGVYQAKPMDLGVKNIQIIIPSCAPGNIRLYPGYRVVKGDSGGIAF